MTPTTDPGELREHSTITGCRIGYIRLDPGDTDISRQALLLDGIGGFDRILVEYPSIPGDGITGQVVWEKRNRLLEQLTFRDVIYTASADRICSGAREFSDLADRIEAAGADLVLLDEGIDTRSPSGRSAIRLARSLAKAESERASRDRREGIRRARENGRRIGRPPVAVPTHFRDICRAWSDGNLSGKKAAEAAGLKTTSFYTRAAELGYRSPSRKKPGSLKTEMPRTDSD